MYAQGGRNLNDVKTVGDCQKACVDDGKCVAISYITDQLSKNCFIHEEVAITSGYNRGALLTLNRCTGNLSSSVFNALPVILFIIYYSCMHKYWTGVQVLPFK